MDRTTVFLLLIACISSNFLRPVNCESDLYSSDDDVVRLNFDTFKPVIFQHHKNVTFVVEFYYRYCGHCQRFAPLYKRLATRARNWTSIVKYAAVDCHKPENVELCQENKVDSVPRVYVFPPNPVYKLAEDQPLNLLAMGEWDVNGLEKLVIDYMGNLTQTRRQYPIMLNAFAPIQETDIGAVNRIYPKYAGISATGEKNHEQDLMFVVESRDSYLGRRLILEYARISSKLEIRRILLDNEELLKSFLTTDDYKRLGDTQPLLIQLADGSTNVRILVRGEAKLFPALLSYSDREESISNRFTSFLDQYYSEELKEQETSLVAPRKPYKINSNRYKNDKKSNLPNHIIYDSRKIYAVDLLKGLSFMITNELVLKGDIDPDAFKTIRNMLTIVSKYLLLRRWDDEMADFIFQLRAYLDKGRPKYEQFGITHQELKRLLDESGADSISKKYNKEDWISCGESERNLKGYPCSLWLLFHTLTVGEYTRAAPVRVVPVLVLSTMREYIIRFFGCSECSTNFAKESADLKTSLTARNSSVLWLWQTHNRVRERLNNEKNSSKLRLADVIFPTQKTCFKCFDPRTRFKWALDDIIWDRSAVLRFMLGAYHPDKIVSSQDLASQGATYDIQNPERFGQTPPLTKRGGQWNIPDIFSTGDMSICLILYAICIVIVAVVCLSLNPRWKRAKLY